MLLSVEKYGITEIWVQDKCPTFEKEAWYIQYVYDNNVLHKWYVKCSYPKYDNY